MAEAPGRRPPPGVKGLSAVSLFNDFASEMVYPLLPAFITGTLGGSAVALGALDGAADLTAAVLRWTSGRLADRRGWAKPLILIGYGSAMLMRPVIAVASAAWQVIAFRVLDRVGKGLRSPARDAMIVALTPEPVRGRAFGFHRAADHLGAVLGSLAAWFFLRQGTDVRRVIGWSIVPGLVAVLVLAVVLRAIPDGTAPAPPGAPPRAAPGPAMGFWGPTVVLVLLTAGRLPETLLLLRLQDAGVAVALIPLVWAGLHVIRSASSYPGGWLSDWLGARLGVAAGTLLYAAVVLGFARPIAAGPAIALFLAHGFVAGLIEPAERVAIAVLSPARIGRGFGAYQGLAGLVALPAGLAFGALYRGGGAAAALIASAAVLLVATPAWLWVGRRLVRG